MPASSVRVVAILCVWCSMIAAGAAAEPDHWKAGVAKTTITPDQPVWMAGYAARSEPSEGVLVDLYARALVLADAHNNRLAIVTLDLIEIPDTLRGLIVDMATKHHGLKPEELLLNVSHTHGGPMVSAKTVADWGLDPAWGKRADACVEEVVEKVDGVLKQAIANLVPATVSYSHSRCGFAMNRRQPTSAGGFRLGPNPDGPVDHDVPVLRIESAEKKLIGLVFGYACHNTALGPTRKLNGDYTGFAQRRLDLDHPDTVNLFLTGCGGDQDPAPRRHQEEAEQNGLALASAVEAALVPAPVPLSAALSTTMEMCPLAFAPLQRADLEVRATSANGFVSRHARWVLSEWPKQEDHPADYQYPVQVVVLGHKLALVALGGEPVVDYSIRLKTELSKEMPFVWVAGYSNLVNAYIPSSRVLQEGGYEGTEAVIYQSLPGPFRQDLEERIVESVHSQVKSAGNKPQVK